MHNDCFDSPNANIADLARVQIPASKFPSKISQNKNEQVKNNLVLIWFANETNHNNLTKINLARKQQLQTTTAIDQFLSSNQKHSKNNTFFECQQLKILLAKQFSIKVKSVEKCSRLKNLLKFKRNWKKILVLRFIF